MNSSIVQLLAFEKLNGDNYATWKSNLNTILVVDDLRFVLTEECPQTPASNVNRASRKAYDRWIKANVATTKGKFRRGSSSKSKVGPSKLNCKIEKKGNGKTPRQNKEKGRERSTRKVVLGKGFLRARSLSKLELVSAKAVGDLKLFFNDRYILLKNVLIGRLVKSGLLSQLEDNSLPPCDSCLEGKMTKRSFSGEGLRAKTPLKLVHSDLCRPMNVKARGGYEYFISFIDDYSRYGHVYLIQNKSDSFEKFKEYKAEVENESDQPNDVKPIGCKWIYKRKRDQAGKMDVKTAFLNGNLEKSIYMVQPEGFIQKDQEQKNIDEPCVYKRIIKSTVAFLVLYGIHLSKKQCPKTSQEVEDMSNIPYASVVGSLMYTMLCNRPDICYSVEIVSRYQSNPGHNHWTAIKNILKYLRRTKDYMLVYGSKDLMLTGYTNSDFQTDKDGRKSTS
ncbi:putative polyprotein [Cucumis melo var. makuwa]|uniref:Polyprotein n=1 Tax=Cucumis melo var. makuwa TaxID=1194695 RepID=A0A5A7T1X5_CUCMM|nr:putative polyprotein [Cucumis melo var. makuwa]TYK31078.1 putative polyprotein [Cucumis melo var. makuwa]